MHLRYQGITIGCTRDDDLYIADYDPPTTEFEGDRTPRLGRHGVAPGRTLLRDAVWQFNLTVQDAGVAGVLDRAGRLERVWKSETALAGQVPLEYSTDHGSTWFRVYGQPGRFTGPKADYLAAIGYGQVDCQFEQQDPLHYSSTERTTTITAAPAVLGMLTVPVTVPVVVGATGAERAGRVSNVGDKPTPVRVTFHGPSQNPKVRTSAGYEIGYRGSLAWDETVVLDPLAQSVLLNGRVPVPGRLTVRSLLSDLVAPTGDSDWRYIAVDESGTSKAVLSWRDAHTSMQYDGRPSAATPAPAPAGGLRVTRIDEGLYRLSNT